MTSEEGPRMGAGSTSANPENEGREGVDAIAPLAWRTLTSSR